MSTPERLDRGFTLIELLVVIAIIGVLVALLLPAVQAAREAARRVQCTNNLMQLSIALQNYEAAHEVLPPGVVDMTGPISGTPQGYHFGWIARILPYIEEKPIYNNLNFQVGVYDGSNTTARSIVISTLLCPSDPHPGSAVVVRPSGEEELVMEDEGWTTSGVEAVGLSSYAANHHDVEAPIDADNHGAFFLNSSVRYEDIPDGTSKTIFLGERRRSADLGWASGTGASLRNTGHSPNAIGPGVAGPGAPAAPGPLFVGGFSGFHAGGVNMALGDGSVRFLKDSISPEVLRRLGHRADGEMISAESF